MVMTPCLALWENFALGSSVGVMQKSGKVAGHRSLVHRLESLKTCRGLNLGAFMRGHFVKPNVTHYFVRAEAGMWFGEPYNYFPIEKEPGAFFEKWRLVKEPWKGSGVQVCFYLGKFPVYWDPGRFSMLYADEIIVGSSYAVGQRPTIVGVNMDLFEALEPGRRAIYYGADVMKTYARQMEYFDYWRGWQKRCIAANYAPEPFRKRYVKGTKMEWPGWPMSDIERPNPENMKPPEVYPPERELPLPMPVKLRLVVRLRQTYSPKADKLFLDMDL